jgi:hypothetical protein
MRHGRRTSPLGIGDVACLADALRIFIVKRSPFPSALLACTVVSACFSAPPEPATTPAIEPAQLIAQIQIELEDDDCAMLYRIGTIEIDRTRVMRDQRGAVLEVRATAALSAAEPAPLVGCNTLVMRRRMGQIYGVGPGASADFKVVGYFSEDGERWRLETADFEN